MDVVILLVDVGEGKAGHLDAHSEINCIEVEIPEEALFIYWPF